MSEAGEDTLFGDLYRVKNLVSNSHTFVVYLMIYLFFILSPLQRILISLLPRPFTMSRTFEPL